MDLADSVLQGERLALARLITQVENQTTAGRRALDRLFPHTGKAHLVGVTGSPGAGKSSLVNKLALAFRHPATGEQPRRVAIVAVDPSSPFTGGAVLGDRVRMRDLAGDPGIFIRSMASRGALGGLSASTAAVVQVLDAAGFDLVLIETVGAGQSEVDIARLAHTTIVVEAPGMGDDIQAIKAGILEIADILVVNKADKTGVEHTERALRAMLELARPEKMPYNGSQHPPQHEELDENEWWMPPVLRVIATEGAGIREVAQAIRDHGEFLRHTGLWVQRDRERLESELQTLIRSVLMYRWRRGVSEDLYQDVLTRLVERSLSPYQAVDELVGMPVE